MDFFLKDSFFPLSLLASPSFLSSFSFRFPLPCSHLIPNVESPWKGDLYFFVHFEKQSIVYELQITITRKANINPTQFNRECCRSDVTLFWTLSWVGVNCAGAGAGAGYDETFDFFTVTSVNTFELFLLNIGVVWPIFPFFDNEPASRPNPWCFPFLSICFLDPYLSKNSMLWRIGIEVVFVRCNSLTVYTKEVKGKMK